jgi:quercetin dioxygenase-like cupin family protein
VRQHQHAGVEFLYVTSGKLALQIGEDEPEFAEGDAIYFESAVPHGYRKAGSRRTVALVVLVTAGPKVASSSKQWRACASISPIALQDVVRHRRGRMKR